MSVRKSDRNISTVEYVNQAINLYSLCIAYISKLPKKYTRMIGYNVSEAASLVARHAIIANRVYVSNEQTKQQRLYHLREALGSLDYLDAMLTICVKSLMLTPENAFQRANGTYLSAEEALKKLNKLSELTGLSIDKERALIRGIINSTNKRKFDGDAEIIAKEEAINEETAIENIIFNSPKQI